MNVDQAIPLRLGGRIEVTPCALPEEAVQRDSVWCRGPIHMTTGIPKGMAPRGSLLDLRGSRRVEVITGRLVLEVE